MRKYAEIKLRKKIILSFLVIIVGIGLSITIPKILDSRTKNSNYQKDLHIKYALQSKNPHFLGRGVIYECELNCSDEIETNKCANVIIELNNPEALRPLRNMINLMNEHRAIAYELIGMLGDTNDAAYLIRVFRESPSERNSCIECFIRVLSRKDHILRGNSQFTHFLTEIIGDSQYQEQTLSAIALYPDINYAQYIEDLIERKCLYFKSKAILAYLQLDAPYSELITSTLFKTAEGNQRHETAVLAAIRGEEQAIRWLAMVVTDPSVSRIQKANAEKYLLKLEARYGLSACMTVYEIDRVETRVRAVESAGLLSGTGKLEFLKQALKDPSIDVRLAAIRSFGNDYTPEAIDILINIIKTDTEPPEDNPEDWKEASICIAAAALGNMGTQEAVPVLANLLWYGQPVRGVVHEALVRITMEDLGADPAAYMNWYEKVNGESNMNESCEIETSG